MPLEFSQWGKNYPLKKKKRYISSPVCTSCTRVVLVLPTVHREDAWGRRLAKGRHHGHPEGGGRLGDRGHDGRRGEGDHVGKIDVVHNERVVSVVEETKVAADTEPLFCVGETLKL